MDKKLRKEINRDRQIVKFCMYGFFKNLKFYEPYLIILLVGKGISLFEIGILFAIREIVINIFEIPSGIIADMYGRKRELSICFIFYIMSFVLFFLTEHIYLAAIAMFFYGLGDAFRTGTHKAIIYSYLEKMGWSEYKSYVYGRTRSVSLIGSSVSSILGLFIILNLPSSNYIFLASISPYLVDFFIILSYPNDSVEDRMPFRIGFREHLVSIKRNFNNSIFSKIMFGQAFFEAVVSSIKDFIQPILKIIILGSGIVLFSGFSTDQNLKIILGLSYTLIYIFSSFASSKAYKFQKYNYLEISYTLLILTLAMLYIFVGSYIIVIMLFLVVQFLQNSRKPIFVAEIDNHINKNERATILSVVSQLKSVLIIILAPITGLIYDKLGPRYSFVFLASILIIVYTNPIRFFSKKKS